MELLRLCTDARNAFNRTYEELKQNQMKAANQIISAFNRTYEELKSEYDRANNLYDQLLIVPMRN